MALLVLVLGGVVGVVDVDVDCRSLLPSPAPPMFGQQTAESGGAERKENNRMEADSLFSYLVRGKNN